MGAPIEHKAAFSKRAFLRAAFVVSIAAPLLAGCGASGFKPLHATGGFGAGVSEKLAKVQIAPIPGRVGQQIRNELVFQSTGTGQPVDSKYRLEVAIRESVGRTLVQRDGEATSQVYNLDATFRLVDLETKEVVLKGQSYGRAGFERFESIYANVRARRNAENRAAKTISSELKTRLEAFLATSA